MRVSVVGCGRWGMNHVRTLKEMGHTVLCCDKDAERLKRHTMLSRYTGAPVFDDANYVYKHEAVDASVIAVPHEHLAKEALRAVAHGIPCLVEKPMATSSWDAWRIWASSKERGVLVMPGFIERFNPYVTTPTVYCDEFAQNIVAFTSYRQSEKTGRSIIWDLLIHDIDLAYYLDADVATFNCEYTDGWKWRSIGYQHTLHNGEPLRDELEHFLDCVQGKTEPRVTVEDGVRAVVAAEIIQSVSANTN